MDEAATAAALIAEEAALLALEAGGADQPEEMYALALAADELDIDLTAEGVVAALATDRAIGVTTALTQEQRAALRARFRLARQLRVCANCWLPGHIAVACSRPHAPVPARAGDQLPRRASAAANVAQNSSSRVATISRQPGKRQ